MILLMDSTQKIVFIIGCAKGNTNMKLALKNIQFENTLHNGYLYLKN